MLASRRIDNPMVEGRKPPGSAPGGLRAISGVRLQRQAARSTREWDGDRSRAPPPIAYRLLTALRDLTQNGA
jgi:hypothetical protein